MPPSPGRNGPGQHVEQRGLTAAVDTDDPHPVPGAEPPGHVVKQRTHRAIGADRYRDVLKFHHGLAQPGGRQPGQFDAVAWRRLRRDQRGGCLYPELRLGAPGLGPALQPGELLAGQVPAATFGGLGAALPLGLREHISRVPALGGTHLAPVDLPGPLAHRVQQPAVVADHDDRAAPIAQMPAEPVDRLDVQVVGGLVEQQHVGLGDEQRGERHAAPFAAGQPRRRSPEADPRQQLGHDRPHSGIRFPRGGHRTARAPEYDLADRSGQPVALRQIAEPQPGRHGNPAGVGLGPAGQQRQQRGLARSIAAHHADPVPGRHAQRNAVEQAAVRIRLGRLLQADQVHVVQFTSPRGR